MAAEARAPRMTVLGLGYAVHRTGQSPGCPRRRARHEREEEEGAGRSPRPWGEEARRHGRRAGEPQMDSPKALTMQYMVLFSHRTVQLPAGRRHGAQPGEPGARRPGLSHFCTAREQRRPLRLGSLHGVSRGLWSACTPRPQTSKYELQKTLPGKLEVSAGCRRHHTASGKGPGQAFTEQRGDHTVRRAVPEAGTRRVQPGSVLLHNHTGHFNENKRLLEKSTWQHTFLFACSRHSDMDPVVGVRRTVTGTHWPCDSGTPQPAPSYPPVPVPQESGVKCWEVRDVRPATVQPPARPAGGHAHGTGTCPSCCAHALRSHAAAPLF